jgi:hypothetical protein
MCLPWFDQDDRPERATAVTAGQSSVDLDTNHFAFAAVPAHQAVRYHQE